MLRASRAVLTFLFVACTGTVDAEDGNGNGNGGPPPDLDLGLQQVVTGLSRPVDLTAPAGDPRLFIVEQPGRIRIVQNGALLPQPFLDITARVEDGSNEQGLLGLAFHPDYEQNGHFFVNYTGQGGNTRVERYTVRDDDPNRADPASAKLIIGYDQPYGNHNGGQVLFGPDGMLYIPTGDGGNRGDPQGNGQNRNSLLGKILRIDVDGGDPYAVPQDNPFVDEAGARPEIWALGLRNPWRVAFDAEDDLLFVADVGQNQWEEVSVVAAAEGGLNFGWNRLEGSHCYPPDSTCSRTGFVLPVIEYPRRQGISITGGYVYRGTAIPELQGRYLYADFGQEWIRSFRYEDGQAAGDGELDVAGVRSISSFGVDGAGEMYVVSLDGTVWKLVPEG